MDHRFKGLDGWRGISILLVIAGHLFPLGPKTWQLNHAIAATGMAIFFVLSGFLVTNILLRDDNVLAFLIRRLCRIVPLAWVVLIFVLAFNQATTHQWLSSMLFYANWPPMGLIDGTGHFWSLCLEVQFYLFIALLVALLKRRAFLLLPVLCLLVTAYRYSNGVEIAINTYYRADEIFAGCCLALLFASKQEKVKTIVGRLCVPLVFLVLVMSAHPSTGPLNYLRPYVAALLVGASLFSLTVDRWQRCLDGKTLAYIASISYPLYVFHGALNSTWLGAGEGFEKYAKRPLLLFVTAVLSHYSTRFFESYWIALGKKITMRMSGRR